MTTYNNKKENIINFVDLLLEYSDKNNSALEYIEFSKMLINLTKINKLFNIFLNNFSFSNDIKKDKIKKIFSGIINNEFISIILTIIDFNCIDSLEEILNNFIEKCNTKNDITSVKIISAFPLESIQVKKICSTLEKKYKKKFIASNLINNEIIGGIKIVFNDIVIDTTFSNKINLIKKTIIEKENE
ncbi:MAG: ATP synthase F1 subunit delta [Mycoplasmataceae bacterium]|nr:ATP synthase F1 subunit delta [Mycoplasmataceae bacterium]